MRKPEASSLPAHGSAGESGPVPGGWPSAQDRELAGPGPCQWMSEPPPLPTVWGLWVRVESGAEQCVIEKGPELRPSLLSCL